MHNQLITAGFLFCLALAGGPSAARGQAVTTADGRPPAPTAQHTPAPYQQPLPQTMPAPVATVPMQNVPRPTIVSPAVAPQLSVRHLPPTLNATTAMPANPNAVRPLPLMPGAVSSQPMMVGVVPVSGQGPQSASPIATANSPPGAPGMLVAAQGVTANGQPVVVYLPPGSQPTANQPWPGGEFTYAPGTNVSSEVPDTFWPSPERQPIGGMVERAQAGEGGGLLRWPKFARNNSDNPAPPASRPPVRQPSIFNRTDDSLFAAKETPKTEEQPAAGGKALFGGGRSTPVARAPAPQLNPAPGLVPTLTPGAPQPPALVEPTASAATAPLQAPPQGSVTKVSTQEPALVKPAPAPIKVEPTTPAVPAAGTSDLKWRAKGSPRPVAPVVEPPQEESDEAMTPAKQDTPETDAARVAQAAEVEPAPLEQASTAAIETAGPKSTSQSVMTKSQPTEDVRQKAILSRSLLDAPTSFVAGLFTAPVPAESAGPGRALMPVNPGSPKPAGPTPMVQATAVARRGAPRAHVAPTQAAPVMVTAAPRQDRALFGGFALANKQQPVAPATMQPRSLPQTDSPTLADDTSARLVEGSRQAPALHSELIEAAVAPPVTSLVPQKQLVHSGPSRRADPQAAAAAMVAQAPVARAPVARAPAASEEKIESPEREEEVRPMDVAPTQSPAVDLVEAMPRRRPAPRTSMADRKPDTGRSRESRQVTYETTQRGPSLGKLLSTRGAGPRLSGDAAQPATRKTEPRQMPVTRQVPVARQVQPIEPKSENTAAMKPVKKQPTSLAEPGEVAAVISDEGSQADEPAPSTTKLHKRNGATVTVITPGE